MSRVLLIFAVACLTACPTFEDGLSGTYQQRVEDAAPGAELISIDLFRYGHQVQLVVRRHANGPAPFQNERDCAWSTPTRIQPDNSFETFIQHSTGIQQRIAGRIEDDGTLTARLNTPEGNADLVLDPVTSVPDETCKTIEARSVTAKFGNLSAANEFAPGEYEIQNPYAGVQWIAVQPIQAGNVYVWTAFTADLVFAPLATKVTENRRGLTGEVSLIVAAPGEDFRTVSGTTRYSLAHFIVIDDDPDDATLVGWDRSTEPIIASAVRSGVRLDPPPGAENHNQYGRALLFVEGRLDELGKMLDILDAPETIDPEQHFYVAEIFAEDERVVAMRLVDGPLTLPVTVTTEYLDQTAFTLPRLFPLD